MPKRKCKLTSQLKIDYPYIRETHDDKVHCDRCRSVFSICHGGRSDIKEHLETKRHKTSIEAAVSSTQLTTLFKKVNSNESLISAAKEATFAFHTAIHGQSFKSCDCTSKLIAKLFDPKFSLAKTKCESVVVNCIVPMLVAELRLELKKANFVTVTIDASNRKEIKLVPVVVRYFVPDLGVKVKLLEFKSLGGKTSEILSNYLVSILDQNVLKEKLVGFCADNCNTNFGGVKRKGKNNVFFKVRESLKRNIIGIGCAAHIVHNCLQHAVDTLPVCVESLVVKMYRYFDIYTVRVTELKIFCDFVEIEYQRILQHGNTRFLSLVPALQRILDMFEALKNYFNSQEGCPINQKMF
uniref:Numb protein n=1 Tax=Phallusia mammillata TaxID=59560 RepID=A0A6F9DMT6_9ASCI|nr:Numb protein [Phallusia mammillata]